MLEEALNSCYYVAKNSEHVIINYKKIDLFLKKFNYNNLKHWLSNNPYDLFDFKISTIINLLLLFESIDYSFWGNPKWNINTESGEKDGSDALLYVIIKYVKENNNYDFIKVSFRKFKTLLAGNVDIPLLKERYKTLVEVSKIVKSEMNGDFYNYIKNIKDDIKLFDIIVSKFPSFKDERIYNGETIYFYKLAQVLRQIFCI